MSWYSDGEKFNEHDDPYCVWKSMANKGKCGNSKAECDACMAAHRKEEKSDRVAYYERQGDEYVYYDENECELYREPV